jgi:hypothetical protein
VPRESLDAPDDLPKQAPCQVALGKLEDEGAGTSDEAPARAHETSAARLRRMTAGRPFVVNDALADGRREDDDVPGHPADEVSSWVIPG